MFLSNQINVLFAPYISHVTRVNLLCTLLLCAVSCANWKHIQLLWCSFFITTLYHCNRVSACEKWTLHSCVMGDTAEQTLLQSESSALWTLFHTERERVQNTPRRSQRDTANHQHVRLRVQLILLRQFGVSIASPFLWYHWKRVSRVKHFWVTFERER